jgi:aminopeptidase N
MRWYSQAGTPEVIAAGTYDSKQQSYRLELAQRLAPTPGQPVKEPMVLPLALGLVGRDGQDLTLKNDKGQIVERGVIRLDKTTETFIFTGVAEAPVLSLNRGFSAPIKLTASLSADDLRFLAAHDSDPFNRWQALQTLATRHLVESADAAAEPDEGLIAALAAILSDRALEPAFVSLALTPPSEADIAREIGKDVDPDAIFRARTRLRAAIGDRLKAPLLNAYAGMRDTGAYSPDAKSAGRRALKNTALDLLAATKEAEAIARAAAQYKSADNMTDRIAALVALCVHDVPERKQAFDDFYARHAGDALIIDKWLALQATIPEAGTLDRVIALTGHPAYSAANPNRVRALIGSFAQANATQFNRADGAGFAFVADQVLTLDPKNPQVAARLATAFRSWRALEPARKAKAEAALRRIAAAPSLSADVKDIVTRALAAA